MNVNPKPRLPDLSVMMTGVPGVTAAGEPTRCQDQLVSSVASSVASIVPNYGQVPGNSIGNHLVRVHALLGLSALHNPCREPAQKSSFPSLLVAVAVAVARRLQSLSFANNV